MNNFNFTGRLAATPTISGRGDKKVAKLVLIRNDVIGKDDNGNKIERTTSIQFTAFNGLAGVIADNTAKGDQLIVTARVVNNNYQKDGVDVYGYDYIIESFDFGAPGKESRERLANN